MSDDADSRGGDRRLLLTGGTGFVGVHAARHLLQKGHRLRCLVRPTSDRSRLPEGIELAEGQLLNFESLQRAAEGCREVVHLGGLTRAGNPRDFHLINRDGTANLVRAAREGGVERFILCSSQSAAGPSTPQRRRLDRDPPGPVSEYGRSKLEGEEALKTGAGEMWWCILRPPSCVMA